MSYSSINALAQDTDFRDRLRVCLTMEKVPSPDMWAAQHAIEVAAQPGLAAAYDSAKATHIDRPGLYEEVISDGMLLAAVAAVAAILNQPAGAETPNETPTA